MPHTRNEESRSVVSGDLGNAYNKKANRQINVLVILDPPNPETGRARCLPDISRPFSLPLPLSLSLPPLPLAAPLVCDSFHPRLCFLLPAITQERNQIPEHCVMLAGMPGELRGLESLNLLALIDRSIDRIPPFLDHPRGARNACLIAKRTLLLGNSLQFQSRNALPLDRARSQPHGKVVASLARLPATEKRIGSTSHTYESSEDNGDTGKLISRILSCLVRSGAN